MRLGIDAREIQNGVYTGIGRPLADLLHYFAGLDNEDSCVLFSARKVPLDLGPRVTNVVLKEHITFVWDQWQLPLALKKEGVDIFYSPYYKVPLMKPCTTVSAILDLMYLSFGPYHERMSSFARAYYAVFGRAYARCADKVLTCSAYSKKDIQRIYGIGACKIEVIPLGLGGIYRPQKGPTGINGRYILYLGNFKVHKNVKNIIKAFAFIAAAFPDMNLVLAGPKEYTYPHLVQLARELHLEHRVVFPGKITESDDPRFLYSGADVFVMPSLYEGFGLPPLEAMACGVPVIVSNTTSMPEVVQDAGILVDPDNVAAIADAMREVLTNDGLRNDLIAKGLRRAREYEADKVSARVYAFLKQTYKDHAGT